MTGALPGGGGGLAERTAFIYDSSMVQRTELVTDVTYDRFEVLDTLVREFPKIQKNVNAYLKALSKFEKDRKAGKKTSKPKLDMPTFLSFVRTPFAVGFEVQGHPGTERYEFLAVTHIKNNFAILDCNGKQNDARKRSHLCRTPIVT